MVEQTAASVTAPAPETSPDVILKMTNISRNYGSIQALDGVDFELRKGEIMALVGENGAGKSTLVKIIGGFDGNHSGTIIRNGAQVTLESPAKAEELGIAIAQQELSLIPTMTVAENIFLADPRDPLWSSLGNKAKRAREYLDIVGLKDVDPKIRVDRLSVGEQHLVEVARLIARNAEILILDEPTAALGEAESNRILDMALKLADEGRSIIYVSHRMDEIFEISHRVTVLRDGHSQPAVPTSELNVHSLIERMLGRTLENMFPQRAHSETDGDVVMSVENLWPDGIVEPVNLDVRAGEILGLAGQLGSGSGYMLAAIGGARLTRKGKIRIDGKSFLPKTPAEAIANKIAYCSADRKKDGLFLLRPIYENFSSPSLDNVTDFGWLNRGKEQGLARRLSEDMTVDVTRIPQEAIVLSGGNQQKVTVGKWLSIEPKVLLVNEPTRGVDVGARSEIYQRLRDLADSGVAVVFASTDIQEITYLPDRIATFYRGQHISTFKTAHDDSARILKEITHPYDDEVS
ncbi:MAG: sugar ABC transporter ATP-binding protein [Chloroflexota bacterium]